MPLPIAVQLYTLRDLKQPFDTVLAEVARIGYTGVETVHTHGLRADEMRSLLEKHRLRIVSSHVAMAVLEDDFADVVAFNKAVGNETLVIPWLPLALRSRDATGWKAIGRRLDKLGRRCRDVGMRLLYHNHDFEIERVEGRLAIDWLFDGADPDNLGFEPDLAWVVVGDSDPIDLLDRYQGRCPRIHVKDVAKPGESDNARNLADVGHGRMNWEEILPAAQRAGAEWLVVEHDLPPDPLASIRRSYEFLRR